MYYNIKWVPDDGRPVLILREPVRIWAAVEIMVQLQRVYPMRHFGYVPSKRIR